MILCIRNIKYFLIFILVVTVFLKSTGQNRLTISSTRSVSLDFKPLYQAGQPTRFLVDDSKWLNYTILVKPNEPACSISVQISSGMIPEGIDIKLKASPYIGTSQGDPGTPTGEISISHVPQVLIENIGTSYTGAGAKIGHQLTYSVNIKDYERLQAVGSSIYLLFTIGQ